MQEENNVEVIKGGPQTDEGKAITRYNAVKHGLLSKEVLLDSEDKVKLEDLENSVYLVFKPEGIMEELMADRIIACMWRLRRAVVVERNSMEWFKENRRDIVFTSDGDIKKKGFKEMIDNNVIEKILRYETTIERSMYRAMHEINRLQAERNGQNPPKTVWANLDVNTDNGFVSQNLPS